MYVVQSQTKYNSPKLLKQVQKYSSISLVFSSMLLRPFMFSRISSRRHPTLVHSLTNVFCSAVASHPRSGAALPPANYEE
jgi:hypothetical protein